MVAIPEVASNAPDENYNVSCFGYDEKNDTFRCPQNHTLLSNGNWYQKNRGKSFTLVKHYKTNACDSCVAKTLCTRNPKGRLIERSEHAPYVGQNKKNIDADPQTYKKRQAIVEHPYGTIKRQWGFYHILTKKGIKRASADVGLMFIAYNLRRIMNILDKNILKVYLKGLAFLFAVKMALFKPYHSV